MVTVSLLRCFNHYGYGLSVMTMNDLLAVIHDSYSLTKIVWTKVETAFPFCAFAPVE